MNRKQAKKLTLSKETLKTLDESMLQRIVAGALPPPTEGYRCTSNNELC